MRPGGRCDGPCGAAGNRFGARASGATQVHDQITEMTPDSPSYHEARAEEQLALAERATTPGAVRAHVALADMHLEILYSDLREADAKP
jgi:hypothetical protein